LSRGTERTPTWPGLEINTREEGAGGTGCALAFGPFRLDPLGRVLWEAGKPLRFGGRALQILIALVERAGETVSTNELLARVWPNVAVESVTLRVQISALRKILSDVQSGIRYVENVSGQGYRFAAPITCLHELPLVRCEVG